MPEIFRIADREVGPGRPVFITAEIGLNHDGDPSKARDLVAAAADAGVDAVKFQVFRAESFVSGDIEKARHQKAALRESETLFEMWSRLELDMDELACLRDEAHRRGVLFYASAFDADSVDGLISLGVPLFKVASGEVTNLPLLRHTASKGLPILMSVGMASLGEIEEAVATLRDGGCPAVGLLHCVANYPPEVDTIHLHRMATLARSFDLPVGYSDHLPSPWASIGAAALGACFLEKHFTLRKDRPGTDHALSADPSEMKMIVQAVRELERALGSEVWEPLPSEAEGRTLFRRGLVARRDIPEGTPITAEMVTAKRPATGILPRDLPRLLGRKARRAIVAGAPMRWEDV